MFEIIRHRLVVVLAGLALTVVACESNEFPGAPTAHAPDRSETANAASAGRSGPARRRRSRPTASAGELPPEHPPVGTGQQPGGPGSAGAGGGVAAPTAGPQGMQPDQFGKTGPLRWDAPDNWRAVKPASRMRMAEYHLSGDGEPATLTVFYFGKGGGGSIEANINRWLGQFKHLASKPSRSTRSVHAMKVHLVDAAGTYTAGAAMGGGRARSHWRMRGAIVESPAGNFFFKLTGPQKTVNAHDSEFDQFVASFRAAGGPK